MKKKYSFIVTLLIGCIAVFSQPVMNSTDFPANYSADIYFLGEGQILSPGAVGANQVWDFSTTILPAEPDGTLRVVPVSTAPDVSSFPAANYCLKTTSVSSAYPSYSFYKLSSSIFELLGIVNVDNIGYNELIVLTNPRTVLEFPYTYNTIINDTYHYGGIGPFSLTATYDAYGTLILPFATYNNVIRQKRIEFGSTYYTFFNTNPFSIIVEGDFSLSGYVTIYKNTTELGVDERSKEKLISIYPNPANTVINLQIANAATIDKVFINDLTGKTVLKQFQNTNQIYVQNLARGIYILNATSGDENYHCKFVKE